MKFLRKLLSAALIFSIKVLSLLFYKTEVTWLSPKEDIDWSNIHLAVILNHTSLFEPLFFSALPNRTLWRAIDRIVVPIADVTMNRPLVGRIFRWLVPHAVSISRKRDETWAHFMDEIHPRSLIVIFPEGRMKRLDGLDKYGKPMSIKGGIADILSRIDGGKLLIAYSGGLHHVQAPGQIFPHLFKTIRIHFEELDIHAYKESLKAPDDAQFRANVVQDLEQRMKRHLP